MISRRKIISRSTDDLDCDDKITKHAEDEGDVWHSEDKLLKDHIQEILQKWDQIDDEIWAKIVCMERNRRVAKAYARAPVLTINGSSIGFDGFCIGLNGFNNPLRDSKVEEVKSQIGSGAKIKMDDEGNILIKRIGKQHVFVKVWQSLIATDASNHCVANDIIKFNGQLEADKSTKLFDMNKFLSNVNRELKNSYPNRRNLESQCISCVSFAQSCHNALQMPIWIMIVNIVALDMLKMKLPATWLRNASVPNLSSMPLDDCDDDSHHNSLHFIHSQNFAANHNHVDHSKCNANKLTMRRWRWLFPNFMGPLLPPRDYLRDEKIRKLKEELQEVRIKIGNIEDFYGFDSVNSGSDYKPKIAGKEKLNSNLCHNTHHKAVSEDNVLSAKPKHRYFSNNNNNNNNNNQINKNYNNKSNNNSNSSKSMYSQYDSGLDSDPYTDNTAIYGLQQQMPIKCLHTPNDFYDIIWK